MVLNATKREEISKAPSKITVVHSVDDRIENLKFRIFTKWPHENINLQTHRIRISKPEEKIADDFQMSRDNRKWFEHVIDEKWHPTYDETCKIDFNRFSITTFSQLLGNVCAHIHPLIYLEHTFPILMRLYFLKYCLIDIVYSCTSYSTLHSVSTGLLGEFHV